MARREKIYRRKRPVRTVLKTLGIIALVLIVLYIVFFFWFQRYIVIGEDGLYLDIPWLRGILGD